MNKVFPLKYYNQVSRAAWVEGPWDKEEKGLDREQWSDPLTGYPCLAIRSELGAWAGYVAVPTYHPAFGCEFDDLSAHGGVTWQGYTDEIHFIEPWPEKAGAHIDPADPKSILDVTLMPDRLWFFGFDTAHYGDVVPVMAGVYKDRLVSNTGKQISYKDINYVKEECSQIAQELEAHRQAVNDGCKEKQLKKKSSDS